jgi:hypothetical protein
MMGCSPFGSNRSDRRPERIGEIRLNSSPAEIHPRQGTAAQSLP